jgi:hypothetical protein
MRNGGASEPGVNFLRYRDSAYNVALFKDNRGESGLSEVTGSDEAIVSTTDDDYTFSCTNH